MISPSLSLSLSLSLSVFGSEEGDEERNREDVSVLRRTCFQEVLKQRKTNRKGGSSSECVKLFQRKSTIY